MTVRCAMRGVYIAANCPEDADQGKSDRPNIYRMVKRVTCLYLTDNFPHFELSFSEPIYRI